MGTPQPHFTKRLRAIGQAVPGLDIHPLILEVQRRVMHIWRKYHCPTYVMTDSQGWVYLLRQESYTADRMVNELPRMFVGSYTGQLDPNALLDDLLSHFLAIGYITESMIYNKVREAEG